MGCTKVRSPIHIHFQSIMHHPLTLPSSRLQVDLHPPHNLRRLNSHHDTPLHPLLPSGSQSRFWSCRHTRRRIINDRTTHPLVIELRSIFHYTPHNGGRHGVPRFGFGQSWYKGGEVGVNRHLLYIPKLSFQLCYRCFYNFLHCSLFRPSHPKAHPQLKKSELVLPVRRSSRSYACRYKKYTRVFLSCLFVLSSCKLPCSLLHHSTPHHQHQHCSHQLKQHTRAPHSNSAYDSGAAEN